MLWSMLKEAGNKKPQDSHISCRISGEASFSTGKSFSTVFFMVWSSFGVISQLESFVRGRRLEVACLEATEQSKARRILMGHNRVVQFVCLLMFALFDEGMESYNIYIYIYIFIYIIQYIHSVIIAYQLVSLLYWRWLCAAEIVWWGRMAFWWKCFFLILIAMVTLLMGRHVASCARPSSIVWKTKRPPWRGAAEGWILE